LAGLSLGDFVQALADTVGGGRGAVVGFFAHELAHAYFGGGLGSRTAYEQFYSESVANFVGLKVVRRLVGDSAYRVAIRNHYARAAAAPALPSLETAERSAIGADRFRYDYGVVLLVALEAAVGERRMQQVLRHLLSLPESERALADYATLREAARAAGIRASEWQRFEAECIRLPIAESECVKRAVEAHTVRP
jgi:hypothetical protein